MNTTYTAKDIDVLEGLDPVRKKPGMYIGGVGATGLHHLVWEILDNSVDEAISGFASHITVTLDREGSSVTIADNGRGIPVDIHPKFKKPALEIILTTLHAGGKFENQNYKTAGGLHGVGASVVNALSSQLIATVHRDGYAYRMIFKRGEPVGKIQRKKIASRATGTTITFHPDPTIFPRIVFNADTIRQRLETTSFIHKGLKLSFIDETHAPGSSSENSPLKPQASSLKPKTITYQHQNGLADYLAKVLEERKALPIHDTPFSLDKDNGDRIEFVFQWTESTDEHLRSYVNGIPTPSGGTHENGLRAGLTKAVRNYIDTHKLQPRGVKITHEDIREGIVAILSIFIADPQFQGQTKDRLNNLDIQATLDAAVRQNLEHWLNHNQSVAQTIVARIILASRAREASRAASDSISRKTATSGGRLNLPGKLSDCSSHNRHDSELFIVEGDSAGGSAKQGRDRSHQAILPLRGKVLNTEGASLKKVLDNKELSDLITALGCGIGKDFDLTRLRYQRLILLADADSDGHHITTLLLTFLYRHIPQLIAEGRVYLAMPPLYRIDIGKQTYWAHDDGDRDRILAAHCKGNAKADITRFKGLGEMMPKTLWETTLNPATRRLLCVEVTDEVETDRVMSDLMGKDPAARFHFIMDRAEQAEALDV